MLIFAIQLPLRLRLKKVRCCCTILALAFGLLNSHNLFAVNISATLENIEGQPAALSISFNQDVRQSKTGDTLTIPLSSKEWSNQKSPGQPLTQFTISDNKLMAGGGNVIKAQSKNGIHLLLSADQKATYGSINGFGVKLSISSDAERGMVLIDQNHAEFPIIDFGHDGIIPPNKLVSLSGMEQMEPAQKLALESMQQTSSGSSNIRMLILYSNEFATGFSSPIARINQLLEFTNQSMQRSGIKIEFTLALAQVLNFDNNLTTSQVLGQVQPGTGAFSGVASLRDQVSADMVAVLSFQPGFSANGVAFVNGDNPNFAFSSTRLSPGCCDSVFAHELGHNLGSGHEHASANPFASNPCTAFNFTGFSCGHGNASGNGGQGWGTIMSRLNSSVVNDVFSNPALNCLGAPCGIPEGQTNPADNFTSFNISRLLVANFRPDPLPDPPSNPPSSPPRNTVIFPPIYLLLDEAG